MCLCCVCIWQRHSCDPKHSISSPPFQPLLGVRQGHLLVLANSCGMSILPSHRKAGVHTAVGIQEALFELAEPHDQSSLSAHWERSECPGATELA